MAAWLGRTGDDRFTGEQAALRRVATLVARGAPPEEVFAAVTEEAGRVLGASFTSMARFDPDGARTVVAAWSSTGAPFPVGARAMLGGRNVATLVSRTGQAARIDDYADASGPIADAVREHGFRAAVGVPVSVDGRIWGLVIADSRVEPLPAGTEARLAGFTELAATAIANAQAHVELRGFAEEQAALRRVATLVARAARPEEVFAVVTEEAGRLLHADHATMGRNDPDGTRTVVAAWDRTGPAFPVGTRWSPGGHNLHTMVSQTGRPARIDNYADASGPIADAIRKFGTRAAVGVPVSVEGRLWGILMVGSSSEPLPAGTEARLAGFTELAAIAIANAEAQADLVRAESERRELETEVQRAERLQTVGQLTSGIAHDFSNLLAVIVGYAQMAEDVTDDPDPELHRILGDIRGAADRAVHLSADLLGFGRRVRVKAERLDLNSLISNMMDLLIMSMSGRGEVITELSPMLPPVRADRGQLEQVLLNLAVNARDAMPAGGTLTIRTSTADLSADGSRQHPGTEPGRYVELAVQDTGIGMTPDVRERIFERFFTTKPGTGTGLGLSTVHGIIADAGGTIEADSIEGSGTTFHIYLPAAPGQPTRR
jgi:signal transduction histidine kinase